MWQAAGMVRHLLAAVTLALLVAACATEQRSAVPTSPMVVTPPSDRADAPVIRRELPETSVPPIAMPSHPDLVPKTPGVATGPPAIVVPADAIYVCVVDSVGTRRQTVIEFIPKVHQLCRRHPEMGPCQYERNACRSAGGRVFAAAGQEITMATEAEYDRKVMRVRFRAN